MTDTEREALCARIDELCAEVERLHADQAHWELGNCPSCPNVVSLQEALEQNAKLRELVKAMTPFLCCMPFASCNTLAANVRERMCELGIEVTA